MTKLEGIHRVRVWDEFTKSGGRKYRKPTVDELEARAALLARTRAESDAIRKRAGLDPVPASWYESGLRAELEARRTKVPATRKAPAKACAPTRSRKPKAAPSKRAPRDPDEPRTARQIYALAARALKALGHEFPSTKGEASELLAFAEGRYTLSTEQKKRITDFAALKANPPIDAEFVRDMEGAEQ